MSESIDLLKSIDASLKAILAGLRQGASASPARQDAPRIASDAELDSDHGDPDIKAKSPRDWTGPSMTGKKYSECPAEYLDLVAERLDYFAETNAAEADPELKKKARWNRMDASRARGWAARIRAGYKPPPRAEMAEADPFGGDDSIPF